MFFLRLPAQQCVKTSLFVGRVRGVLETAVGLRDRGRTRLAGTVLRVRPEADGRNHEARVDVSLSSLPRNVVFGVRLDAEITRSAAP